MKTHISIFTAALFAAFISTTYAGPDPANRWPTGFPTRVTTKAAAEDCCQPKEKVALACKDCKTVNEKPGEEKSGILGWFKADSMHDCSGCKGKITVKQLPTGQGTSTSIGEYKHVCSKCGPDSAFTCATHKKK
jgi:hypothetical protein